MTNNENLRKLMERATEYGIELLNTQIPVEGRKIFSRATFIYPGTNYRGYFDIIYDELCKDETGRRIRTSMGQIDSDRIVSHFLAKGTNQELIQWLESPECIDELMKSYQKLKAVVDTFD